MANVNSGDVVIKTNYFAVTFVGYIAGNVSAYEINFTAISYAEGVPYARIPMSQKFSGTLAQLFKKCSDLIELYGWY